MPEVNPELLTDAEIHEITGADRPSKQAEMLNRAGIFYWTRLDGKIRTTWFHVNHPNRGMRDDAPHFEVINGPQAQRR